MRFLFVSSKTLPFGLAIIALLFLLSCAQPSPRIEPDNLVWPFPPDIPRIKYVKSIYSEDDLGRMYSFVEKIFGKAYFDTMVRPYSVYAGFGKLIISDLVLRRVTVYSTENKKLITVIDSNSRKFRMPASAVCDADGNVYIADSGGSSVVVFDKKGIYQNTLLIPSGKPVALALNERLGKLYIADRQTHRIIVYDLQGNHLLDFGGHGFIDGKFNIPLAIAIDNENRVYVLDSGNFRVQIFDSDGQFIFKFGEVGDRPGMFANPKGIALDSVGHIYVTDAAFSNFQIFDSHGRILLHVGEMGLQPGFFNLPGGISIDNNDRIYVADQLNSRIQVFQYLKSKE